MNYRNRKLLDLAHDMPCMASFPHQCQGKSVPCHVTRVASREQLEREAATAITRCQADGDTLSLLVFDIDRLKAINDTFGHQAGDEVLRDICRVVRQSLRPSDTLGRIGDDEFAVLLPQTGEADAEQIGTRIIRHLSQARVGRAGHDVSASIGVAEWQPDERYEQVFGRADAALYQAKLGGRTASSGPGSIRNLLRP